MTRLVCAIPAVLSAGIVSGLFWAMGGCRFESREAEEK